MTEPVIAGGAATAFVTSLVALLGLVFHLSSEVQAALSLVVTNGIIFATVFLVRRKVTPTATLPKAG